MTFIFEIQANGNQEEVAIVADTLRAAETEIRVIGILLFGGLTFKLKEIMGLNEAGLRFYSDPEA